MICYQFENERGEVAQVYEPYSDVIGCEGFGAICLEFVDEKEKWIGWPSWQRAMSQAVVRGYRYVGFQSR